MLHREAENKISRRTAHPGYKTTCVHQVSRMQNYSQQGLSVQNTTMQFTECDTRTAELNYSSVEP